MSDGICLDLQRLHVPNNNLRQYDAQREYLKKKMEPDIQTLDLFDEEVQAYRNLFSPAQEIGQGDRHPLLPPWGLPRRPERFGADEDVDAGPERARNSRGEIPLKQQLLDLVSVSAPKAKKSNTMNTTLLISSQSMFVSKFKNASANCSGLYDSYQ